MKVTITKEITGKIGRNSTDEYFRVNLYEDGEYEDRFVLNLQDGTVSFGMLNYRKNLLKVESFEDYIDLIGKLGLDIYGYFQYRKHWTPNGAETYFYIDITGKIQENVNANNQYDIHIINFYNAFPTQELAEKAIKSSKLGRLILLWQYANNCLYTPNWNDGLSKCYISYNTLDNVFRCKTLNYTLRDNSYFETSTQTEAFIKMYETEIKEIMGVN